MAPFIVVIVSFHLQALSDAQVYLFAFTFLHTKNKGAKISAKKKNRDPLQFPTQTG